MIRSLAVKEFSSSVANRELLLRAGLLDGGAALAGFVRARIGNVRIESRATQDIGHALATRSNALRPQSIALRAHSNALRTQSIAFRAHSNAL